MNVIFVGGPDGKKFINNYIQSLASHGVNVVRHWPDPSRKTYVPADVQAVIVNGDASSPVQRAHVKAMCERDGVPMIVGNNSVSKTVTIMAEHGLISSAPEIIYDNSVTTDDVAQPYQINNTNDAKTSENSGGEKPMKLEEAKEMIIDTDGGVKLTMVILSGNKDPITRSLKPVVWGEKFFASQTALAQDRGIAAANLSSYLRSGNPFQGKPLREASPEDVLNVFPDIKVTDRRERVSRVVDIDGGRSFVRLDGGRRQKLVMCPDNVVRTVGDACDRYSVTRGKLMHDLSAGREGFREPSASEIAAAWPKASFSGQSKAVETSKNSDVRLADIVTAPPGTNFVALVLNDNAFLVPVSDAARALVPETRLFRDLDSIRQLFPVGLLTVRL